MAGTVGKRPFDDFRVAITDSRYFVGRDDFLRALRQAPFEVRFLLGGRRTGKTSTLRAVESGLLAPLTGGPYRAFPVFISLEVEQPDSLAHLRYLLYARLREAMNRWSNVRKAERREAYDRFLRQMPKTEITIDLPYVGKLKLSDRFQRERQLMHDDFRHALLRQIKKLRRWQFEGVCFLLDEAEFIVRREWANNAWSYIRGLKDTDTALKPFLGFLLSGYRNVKEYQQRVGSPLLNIARVEWLTPLRESETRQLMESRSEEERLSLSSEDNDFILDWAGGHPSLTQQMLNAVFDARQSGDSPSAESLMPELLRQHDRDFAGWWNADQRSDGFGDAERVVYDALRKDQERTAESLAQSTGRTRRDVDNALEVLVGTGVVQQSNDGTHRVGARLFEEWVAQEQKHRS